MTVIKIDASIRASEGRNWADPVRQKLAFPP
jgi:hypothetical protein